MVKKRHDVKKWLIWGGIPAAIVSLVTVIVTCSKTVTAYADLPKKVEDTKQDVGSIQNYIKEQRMQNELMQKMVSQGQKKVVSPDGRFYWNEEKLKWEKIL